MNEMTPRSGAELARLDGLASEARAYSEAIQANMLQLGRVFTEAKTLVKHGEWGRWLDENSGMTERSAQMLMQAYSRFGTGEQYSRLGKSKIFKMLQLPEGTEEKFVAENDVSAMTAREVEAAVKKVRAEFDEELKERIGVMERRVAEETKSREAAEKLAEEMAKQPREIAVGEPPKELLDKLAAMQGELDKARAAMDQMTESDNAQVREYRRLLDIARQTNEELQLEMDEQAELLRDMQGELDRTQADLLNMQSAAAKGDAERSVTGDEMTLEAFSQAVSAFIGACARMPHMGRTFAVMLEQERTHWRELLDTVSGWLRGAEIAMQYTEGSFADEILTPAGGRTVNMGGFEITLPEE
jgi:hypothetical protein